MHVSPAVKKLLIIFYKNPDPGKVKTRLASTIGDDKALVIYHKLATHTRAITENLALDKVVYYTDHIDTKDNWNNHSYQKALQQGHDLGERMHHAFVQGFRQGYNSICIIGTDCLEIDASILVQGFRALEKYHAVIGPALDGGYYLLGMNKLYSSVFTNKNWSTRTVATDTVNDFKRLNLSYFSLPPLRDIDTEEDLPPALRNGP